MASAAIPPGPEEATATAGPVAEDDAELAATAALLAGLMGAAAAVSEEGAGTPSIFDRALGALGLSSGASAAGTRAVETATPAAGSGGRGPAAGASGAPTTGPGPGGRGSVTGASGGATVAATATVPAEGPSIRERILGLISRGPSVLPPAGRPGTASTAAGPAVRPPGPVTAATGGTGLGPQLTSILDGARTLREYVSIAARAATFGPFVLKKEEKTPPEPTWANAIITSMGSRSAAETLEDHVRKFDSILYVEPVGNEALADRGDLTLDVKMPDGKTKGIVIRNPYNPTVAAERAGAKTEGGILTNKTNSDAIRDLGVVSIKGFEDSRRQVRLLESLWLCGNNRGIGCFPEMVMLELVEAMKVGSEEKARKAAEKILQNSSMGMLKSAVDKYLKEKPKAVATAASAAGGSTASSAAAAGGAAVPSATAAATPMGGAAASAAGEAPAAPPAGGTLVATPVAKPGAPAVAPAATKPAAGGARRTLRVNPSLGAMRATIPSPPIDIGALSRKK